MRTIRSTFVALSVALLAIACSTNPATGQREFNIVSEGQEVAMGQQSHPEILRQFGVYDEKPELNRLVDRIGKQLAAQSERPNLPWTFTVLDTPMVNAMALPGGYIYITRGMLERINSEDELAGVLGHEIAHVTARHAARSISRSQIAQLGLVLGAVLAPEAAQAYGQFAELGLNLLFQRYSRQQETQADLLGTGYLAEARFNPIGAERMLMTLDRLDKNEVSGIDRYFLSHPEPAKRVRDVRQKITELSGMASGANFEPPDRDGYLRLLDGIITANATEQMIIRDNTIYDRAHGMVIRVPQGWTATMQPGVLFAMSPRGRGAESTYLVAQEIDLNQLQGRTVDDAVRLRLQQMGLTYAGAREARAATGERFTVDVWQGQTQAGRVGVETTQFRHGDHVAVFLFVSPNVSGRNSPLGEVLRNMDVSSSRARSVDAPRMEIGTVRRGESWADLARRATGDPNDAEEVANLNGFDLNTPPSAGMSVKLPDEVVQDE